MEQQRAPYSRVKTYINGVLFGLVAIMGLQVMIAWAAHVPALISELPELAPMQFNSALCFTLLGMAGVSHVLQWRWPLIILSVIGFLLALVTLIQYPLQLDLGIDQLFVEAGAIGLDAYSGRMAPSSAISHVLAFSSLLVLSLEKAWSMKWASWLGIVVICLGIVSLAGYIINVDVGFNWAQYAQMGLHSSIGFVLAGLAISVMLIPKLIKNVNNKFNLWPYEIILLATVFLIDLQIPQGVAVGLLYVLPLLASGYFRDRRYILLVAAICNSLIVADILLATQYVAGREAVMFNRFMSIVAVWISAFIFFYLKRTSEKRQEADMKFKLAVEGTAAGLWDWISIDEDKEWWSPQFYHLLGYKNEEIPATLSSFSELVHPEDKEFTFKMVDRHFTKRTPFQVEYRLKHKSGKYKWFLGTGQATWDDDGKPLRMVGTIIDINPGKLAEEAERERSEQLREKNRQLEEFTYVASHDLQEPVRTISSFAGLFAENYKDRLDEEAQQYLQFIKEASERSQQLIIDLLDYGRLGKNPGMQEMDLNETLEHILVDMSAKINESKAEVQYDKLPVVLGLTTELRLLIQNLISNAIKFRKKDVVPKVKISVRKLDGLYEFAVSDNGIGIEEKYWSQIFVIFRRLHGKTEYEGTGIGLAHCKKVIELHGGTIWLKSTVGEGTIFYFTLPIPT